MQRFELVPTSSDWWKSYNRYLQSAHWRKLRQSAIDRYGRVCVLTGVFLKAQDTRVHHWVYCDDFRDTTTDDLSVLSEVGHDVVHYWIDLKLIDRYDADNRLVKMRELYAEWLKAGKPTSPKVFKRLVKWLKRKRRQIREETDVVPKTKRGKKRRKKVKTRIFGKGFEKPRLVWATVTEAQRHRAAFNRNGAFA